MGPGRDALHDAAAAGLKRVPVVDSPHAQLGEMTTGRLEAFSDGVIAIIVTIMVLELRAPSQPTLAGFWKVAPVFLSYGLSFLVVAIMWVNHHHLIHAVRQVTARLLWSNLNLLFWMSLVPFVTDYLGRTITNRWRWRCTAWTSCASAFYLLRIDCTAAWATSRWWTITQHPKKERLSFVLYLVPCRWPTCRSTLRSSSSC